MSRKSPCLFVKPTSSRGKYFIVDFENLQNTLIKSLVKLTNVPPNWGVPSEREINEMKELNSLFMKEQVVMHGEEYIENELVRIYDDSLLLNFFCSLFVRLNRMLTKR